MYATLGPRARARRLGAASGRSLWWLLAGLLGLLLTPTSALAAPSAEAAELFEQGTSALKDGRYEEAIRQFEALADKGLRHPDAAYNRGLAYLSRVRSGTEAPGDLGRAAAAFEEARVLDPGDDAAVDALAAIRTEVAKRRAKDGKQAVDARPTLDRAVVGLLSERGWSIAAIACSWLLALGLVLRSLRRRGLHITGSVMSVGFTLALLAIVPCTVMARHLRENTQRGVVVVEDIYLQNQHGDAVGEHPIPEAALVEVQGQDRSRFVVRWGAEEGYVPSSAVRVVPSL